MTLTTPICHDERKYTHHINQHTQCNNDKRMHCMQHLTAISQKQRAEYLQQAARITCFALCKIAFLAASIKYGNQNIGTLGNAIIDGLDKTSSLYSESKHISLQNAYKICDTHLTQCQQDKLSSLFERLDYNQEEYEKKRHDILRAAAS